jgi:flagellar hook-length control protein FliK
MELLEGQDANPPANGGELSQAGIKPAGENPPMQSGFAQLVKVPESPLSSEESLDRAVKLTPSAQEQAKLDAAFSSLTGREPRSEAALPAPSRLPLEGQAPSPDGRASEAQVKKMDGQAQPVHRLHSATGEVAQPKGVNPRSFPDELRVTGVKVEQVAPPRSSEEAILVPPPERKSPGVEAQVIEPARTAEARPSEIVSQISRSLETMERIRQPVLRLQLQPEDLGKIELRLSVRSDGVHVTMNASQSDTAVLLERYLPDLRQSLTTVGVQLAGLSIGQGNTHGGGQGSQQWKPHSLSHPGTAFGGQEVQETEPETNPHIKTSAYDVRV